MIPSRSTWAAAVVLAALAAGFVPGVRLSLFAPQPAQAQNLGQRTVSGAVIDDASAPVVGATVFLKNLKTKTIRSFTTTEKGRFQFVQVNMAEDHELWAEKNGKKSPVKTVSSWDTRKNFETELKLK